MTDINKLDEDKVTDAQAFIRAFLQEEYPSMDLEPGRVFHDLVLRPGALVHALNQQQQQLLIDSGSLLKIEENPDLADNDAVDRVLSNYMIYRRAGTYATGQVQITVNSPVTTTVGAGDRFEANGLYFQTTQPFIGTTGALTTQYSRPMTQINDSTWVFIVDVIAENPGTQYMLKQGTRIVWQQASNNYVDSTVVADFTGGSNTETNAELIKRMREGVAAKVLAGRVNIEALLRDTLPSIEHVSIIGNGDVEMRRDLVFGVSAGGAVDIYCKTTAEVVTKALQKECTLIDVATKRFQFSISRDEYPGFYTIGSIYPPGVNTYGSVRVITEERAIDVSDLPYPAPSIPDNTYGIYTRFQTALVTFEDPGADITGLTAGDKRTYVVNVVGIPGIDTLQDTVSDPANRNVTADYLVKAPVPMFVGVNLIIGYTKQDDEVPVDLMRTAVVNAVNSQGFGTGRLPASLVIEAAQSYCSGNMAVRTPIHLVGSIYKPNGDVQVIRSQYELVIPDSPNELVTPRVATFYTTASVVLISTELISTGG